MTKTPALEASRITKSFNGIPVLKGVDLQIGRGEVVGLLGANGAGKSTLLKILCGAYTPDSGDVSIGGTPFRVGNVDDAERLGIRVIYQELSLFDHLRVYENIFIRKEPTRFGVGAVSLLDRSTMIEKTREILNERLGVHVDPTARVAELTSGQRQLVEIARAVSSDARVVMMDEPTTSLEMREKEILSRVIRELVAAGTSVLYISHDLDEVMETCNRIVVLRDGLVASSRKALATSVPEIIQDMVGERIQDRFPHVDRTPGDVVLGVDHLSVRGAFADVSLTVRTGEIVGVAGLSGSGKRELARAICGQIPHDDGRLVRGERELPVRSVRDAVRNGIIFVPSDRKAEGVFPGKGAAWNSTIGALGGLTRGVALDVGLEKKWFAEYVERFAIMVSSPQQPIESLSGGNQQKILVSRAFLQKPHVLVMEEPTRGVDVRTRADMYRLVAQFAAEGNGVLVISSDDDELVGLCDRIAVMYNGTVQRLLEGAECTVEAVKFYSMTSA